VSAIYRLILSYLVAFVATVVAFSIYFAGLAKCTGVIFRETRRPE